MDSLSVLGQLDDVSIEVRIASATAPRLVPRLVKNSGTCFCRLDMRSLDVINPQTDKGSRRRLLFGRIQREVKVGALCPGDLGVLSPDPAVIHTVVTGMEVEAKGFPIKGHRSVQIGHLQDHRD